jgi:hypothetical protein
MKTPALNLVRYRFGKLEQVIRHLQVVERNTLLFLHGKRSLPVGAQVMVEVDTGRPFAVLRGSVVGYGTGDRDGTWVRLPGTKAVDFLRSGVNRARKARRLSTSEAVQVSTDDGGQQLAELLDLDEAGGHLRGLRLTKGVRFELSLWPARPGSTLGPCEVARADGSDLGFRFLRTALGPSASLKAAVARLTESWEKAPVVEHKPGCCLAALLDPPPPRGGIRTPTGSSKL